MTITYIGENHGPATNTKGIRVYTRSFKLKTSLQTERAYHVGSHVSLPAVGEVHPDDGMAWCLSLSVDPSDPWRGWTVTAEYSTERELAENPTGDPAVITWSSEQFQKAAIVNVAGEAIVNSAGDPFDPPLMIDDSRPNVSVSKNVLVVPAWVLTYQDAVNVASFVIDGITVAAGLAKIQSITIGAEQSRNGITFRNLSFTLHLQRQGWQSNILDAGFRQLDYSGGLENIRNEGDGELPAAPVPLDGAGMALTNPSPATAVYRVDTIYQLEDFTVLPFT